jgi:hypothetical protein
MDTVDPWWTSSLLGEKHANRDKHRTEVTEATEGEILGGRRLRSGLRRPRARTTGEDKHRTRVTEEDFGGRNLLNTTEASG